MSNKLHIKKRTNQSNHADGFNPHIIKVNPYEIPENVMELMANICSAKETIDSAQFWKICDDARLQEHKGKPSLYDYFRENRELFYNPDFYSDLNDVCRDTIQNLTSHDNTEHTRIVVAGGFSSGKSSFLNKLTNSAGLLPTGTEPISVVTTYLYCSKKQKNVSVLGINQRNVMVSLDQSVLQAIQHSNKSHVYLAAVLEKLFVHIPSQDLDGLVFIDTPGYNNSDLENQSNGKTDRQTAQEAIAEGDVLFWLVDSQRGTIPTDDIEMIKDFDGKKVIIFTKADKIGEVDSKKIVEETANTISKEFSEDEIIDILAYSSLDNKVFYSKNSMTLKAIISAAIQSGNGKTELKRLRDTANELFEEAITASELRIEDLKVEHMKATEGKRNSQKILSEVKEYLNQVSDNVKVCIIDYYDQLLDVARNLADSSSFIYDRFEEFLDDVTNWDSTDHECWDNTLTPILNKGRSKIKRSANKHNSAIKYNYLLSEWRQERLKEINEICDKLIELYTNHDESESSKAKDILEELDEEKVFVDNVKFYQRLFMSAFDSAIKTYEKRNVATSIDNDEREDINIFESIKKYDEKAFQQCFAKGVDMSVCNPDGFSPLTFAAHEGNILMVKFMLDHGAKPDEYDRRGYNAFHTAVEDQYRAICELLLYYDSDLIDTRTRDGVTAIELVKKHSFSTWLQEEIDNAF